MAKKTLEINPFHPIVLKLRDNFEKDKTDRTTKELTWLLYETSLLTSGFSLDDPNQFASRIHKFIGFGLDIGEEEELSLGGFYDPIAPNYSVNKFLLSLSNRSTLSIVGTQDNIIGDTGYEPFAASSALGSLGLSSAKDVVYHRFLAIQSSEYNTITLYGSDNHDNTSFNGNVSVAIYSNDVTLDAPESLLTFGTTAFNTNMQNKYININNNRY